jgi:ATP-dependent RNA helicase RhlE
MVAGDWRDEGEATEAREAQGAVRDTSANRVRRDARPASAPSDPFFDKPYEATAAPATETPAWENSVKNQATRTSANIKPKRKVAALFKSAA